MENKVRVSVVLATYNGDKYLKAQIDSILKNLESYDELIISDDGSTDETIKIIKSYKDKRIKLFSVSHVGVKKNFENGIINSEGKYIFLSDQDDIWSENKVDKVLKYFNENKNVSLIVHDAIVFDSNTKKEIYNSFIKFRKSKKGIIYNILKNSYIGCCMAFRSELKNYIIPIPNEIEMHDQWIGIINELKCNKSLFIEDKLIKYRRHEKNTSSMKHYTLSKMVINRIILIKELFKKIL